MASIPPLPGFSPDLGQKEDTRVTELAPPRAGRLAVLVQAGNASQADDFGGTPLIPVGGGIQIGRGVSLTGSGPPFDDPRVSRAHAEITRASGGYQICDLGSTNGTFVDGARVNEPFPIQDGSVIGVGPYVFVFRMIPRTALAAVGEELATPFGPVPTVSADAAMIIRRLRALARVELDILITGETGVGKEVYARSIHRASGRQGRFLAINCAAIPENLIESELFGYAKGAHSTATDAKAGLLEEADGGTLFLDEIGDMPMPAQTKLLRFLQDRRFVPLGSTRTRQVNVRIVAATGRGVSTAREDQGLRLDLASRLGPEPIRIPPLRSRVEDVGGLVKHFLGEATKPFTVEAYQALFLHSWPGNVRELEKVIALAVVMSENSPEIGLEHLTETIADRSFRAEDTRTGRGADGARTPAPTREDLEALLARHQGDVASVARELGRQRTLVWRWIRKQGCDPALYRETN
jgi:pSer/pThr/pTyr-binding forkhead associated (FHA) protein